MDMQGIAPVHLQCHIYDKFTPIVAWDGVQRSALSLLRVCSLAGAWLLTHLNNSFAVDKFTPTALLNGVHCSLLCLLCLEHRIGNLNDCFGSHWFMWVHFSIFICDTAITKIFSIL